MKKIITTGISVCCLLLAGNSFGQQELKSPVSETAKTEPKKLEKKSGEEVASEQNSKKLVKSTTPFEQRKAEKQVAAESKKGNLTK